MSAGLVLVVRRRIQAPVERVFDAWTRPELLRSWWGPAPVRCSDAEVDLRVGGRYRIGNVLPDGKVLWIHGVFELVEPPNLLAYSWQVEGAGRAEDASRVAVRFEPRGAETEVVITHERIDTAETRSDHENGWNGCLDSLERLFA